MENMKIQILRNESFAMLVVATGLMEKELEELIIKNMLEERLMSGDQVDCGCSLQQIANENDYDSDDLLNVLFPDGVENTEIERLIDSVFIWGDGSEFPCPICGCECDGEEDGVDGHVWTDWKCSNDDCDFKDSGEPDWDVLPGGYAYENEN